MSQKRPHSSIDSTQTQETYTSHEIHDRGSKFIAHFHPFPLNTPSSPAQPSLSISAFFSSASLKTFQNHPSFQGASHRIIAWRKPTTQQTLPIQNQQSTSSQRKQICTTKSDEDGETHAGKHLEKVLNELDVCGVLVVGRWFGGVLLGPVRFAHIQNVAREAVGLYLEGVRSGDGKRVKIDDDPGGREMGVGTTGGVSGVKVLDEAQERRKMVRQLEERDRSISVLRELLAEKRAMLAVVSDGDGDFDDTETEKGQHKDSVVDRADPGKTNGEGRSSDQDDGSNNQPDGNDTEARNTPKANAEKDDHNTSSSEQHRDPVGSDLKDLQPTTPTPRPPSPTMAQSTPPPSSSATVPPSSPKVNYTTLPLPILQKLSKARDATIAWVLKELDDVDSQS